MQAKSGTCFRESFGVERPEKFVDIKVTSCGDSEKTKKF